MRNVAHPPITNHPRCPRCSSRLYRDDDHGEETLTCIACGRNYSPVYESDEYGGVRCVAIPYRPPADILDLPEE